MRSSVGVAVVLAAVAAPSAGASIPPEPPAPSPCPIEPQHLTRNAIRMSKQAAVDEARDVFAPLDTRGVRVTAARFAWRDRTRGRQVRHMCGRFVQRRTVVVYVLLPHYLPSASVSQGVVFVSRIDDRYQTWYRAH